MIKVQNITKEFNTLKAINDVSFELNKGDIIGLLGPNGSGKTTLLRIISTYLEPSFGDVMINNYSVLKNPYEIRKIIGYLPESNMLYHNMKVKDFLQFSGEVRGLKGDVLKNRLDWCVEVLNLKDVLDKKNFECSKGYRQRIAMVAALIHDPEIIMLDEPTSGLNPLQIIALRDFLLSLVKEKLIILSTHVLQEIASLASRVIIMHQGKIHGDISFSEKDNRTEKLESIFVNAVKEEDVI